MNSVHTFIFDVDFAQCTIQFFNSRNLNYSYRDIYAAEVEQGFLVVVSLFLKGFNLECAQRAFLCCVVFSLYVKKLACI